MFLKAVRILNFRRLKDVLIELDNDITIFVGANNSGKTSATHVMQTFISGRKERISAEDFHVDCWSDFEQIGEEDSNSNLPTISIDLWLHVSEAELHRATALLPSIDWAGEPLGIRIEFTPKDTQALLAAYQAAAKQAKDNRSDRFHPWPTSLYDYIKRMLQAAYTFKYYALDFKQFNRKTYKQQHASTPSACIEIENGAKLLQSLIKVNTLHAQRHLADANSPGRSEDIASCLTKSYSRLPQRGTDYAALRALVESEQSLDKHFDTVMGPMLRRLQNFGLFGKDSPHIHVKADLQRGGSVFRERGAVYHLVPSRRPNAIQRSLPDENNGLGFKNLSFMLLELFELQEQWQEMDGARTPIHLIFIEEPEAHLHAQIQQVFIRNIADAMQENTTEFHCQITITTHSAHILFERGFDFVRYFRRTTPADAQSTDVIDVRRELADGVPQSDTNFLERYMKLTHCDLFFADAAILIEGTVERLLMPLFIEASAEDLKHRYLSIIEVGGNYAHVFLRLLTILGIDALIITDLDSVCQGEDDDSEAPNKSCMATKPSAVTANQAVIRLCQMGYLQPMSGSSSVPPTIEQILRIPPEARQIDIASSSFFITFQRPVDIEWNGLREKGCGRTIEETFALENLEWISKQNQRDLGFRLNPDKLRTPKSAAERVYNIVKSSSFKKTDFALGLMAKSRIDDTSKLLPWRVPQYIVEGLHWLAKRLHPVEVVPSTAAESSVDSVMISSTEINLANAGRSQ